MKAAIDWAYKQILSLGYTMKIETSETVQETAWSYVARFTTSDGYIYLKQTPALISLEATITNILHDQFNAPVPEVIAHNSELHCFLMRDSGKPLRDILKKKFDIVLSSRVIEEFSGIQVAVADRVDAFLEIGVPDWRLDELPALYLQLLEKKDLLISDGLSEAEIDELRSLQPVVTDLCAKLADYSIKQTIVQFDCNDNNTLIDNVSQAITIIDLGEIVISHPFLSLINFLFQMKKQHRVTESNTAYGKLLAAGLKNYRTTETKERLLEALELTHMLWPVYWSLGQYRLRAACGDSLQMPGRLSSSLKLFIIKAKDFYNEDTNSL